MVTVGNSVNKNISQLIVAINNFASLYSSSAFAAPITVTTSTYSVVATNSWVIVNYNVGTCTLTLPNPTTLSGRVITIKTVQAQQVVSASANVVPINGTAAGTAILAATAGKFATLVSNGTNWVIMQAN